jgi:hypothetical protein
MKSLKKVVEDITSLPKEEKRKLAFLIASSVSNTLDLSKPISKLELEVAIYASMMKANQEP